MRTSHWWGWHRKSDVRCLLHYFLSPFIAMRLADKIDPPAGHMWSGSCHRWHSDD